MIKRRTMTAALLTIGSANVDHPKGNVTFRGILESAIPGWGWEDK
jgi:hypothetical protein